MGAPTVFFCRFPNQLNISPYTHAPLCSLYPGLDYGTGHDLAVVENQRTADLADAVANIVLAAIPVLMS